MGSFAIAVWTSAETARKRRGETRNATINH